MQWTGTFLDVFSQMPVALCSWDFLQLLNASANTQSIISRIIKTWKCFIHLTTCCRGVNSSLGSESECSVIPNMAGLSEMCREFHLHTHRVTLNSKSHINQRRECVDP